MNKNLGLFFVLIMVTSSAFAAKKVPILKVRIAKSLKQVTVSGQDLKRYLWPQKSLKQFLGHKKIKFNCAAKNRRYGQKPIRLASIKSKTGLLSWDREHYKGLLHIQTDERLNGCDIINELSMEDYLTTLLPKEMSPKWPMEALKAQAVAARSYAYFKLKTAQVSRTKGFKTNYDLENSEKHQVNGSFFDATTKTIEATRQTRGQILTFKNKRLTPVFYHSKCGGKTLTPGQVWQNHLPGYRSVECPFCHKHGMKNWEHKFAKKMMVHKLEKVLKQYHKDYSPLWNKRVTLVQDKQANSKLRFYREDDLKTVKKSKLRSILGRKALPSNYFKMSVGRKHVLITGAGYGHGVGMCQYGAKEMALQGYNYKQILAHYFPDLKLKKIY